MFDTLLDAIDTLWGMWYDIDDTIATVYYYVCAEVTGSWDMLPSFRQLNIGIWATICASCVVLGSFYVLKFIEQLRDTDTSGNMPKPAVYDTEPSNFPGSPANAGLESTFIQSPASISYTPPGSPEKRIDISTPRNVIAEGENLRESGFFHGDPGGKAQSGRGGHFGFGRGAGERLYFENFTGESLRTEFKDLHEQRKHHERLLGLTPAKPPKWQRLRPRTAGNSFTEGDSGSAYDQGLLD